MTDAEYFSNLYEIAKQLNASYALPSALRSSLKKTAELLELETGWIWLEEPDGKSVYLAASYNLPPALSKHPERLSGWCFCIEKYLAGNINKAVNVSEITCTRLKDLTAGTRDLKFHATIPIIVNAQRIGILNLVSREKQRLNQKELSILNTISELMGMAVQRTRLQNSPKTNPSLPAESIFENVVIPTLEIIESDVKQSSDQTLSKKLSARLERLKLDVQHITDETKTASTDEDTNELRYPSSPLTNRELDVLQELRLGKTNAQIADKLAITERTVKFHMTSILSKLFAETRTQAVHVALQRGLIQ